MLSTAESDVDKPRQAWGSYHMLGKGPEDSTEIYRAFQKNLMHC